MMKFRAGAECILLPGNYILKTDDRPDVFKSLADLKSQKILFLN